MNQSDNRTCYCPIEKLESFAVDSFELSTFNQSLKKTFVFWVAVDEDGEEWIFIKKPQRDIYFDEWDNSQEDFCLAVAEMKQGFALVVTGEAMSWESEPREVVLATAMED